MLENRIPLEICISSNVISGSVSGYDGHHFNKFWGDQYPMVICTDDTVIFNSSISNEYCIIARTFDLNTADLVNMSRQSIEYSFASDGIKKVLRERFEQKLSGLNNHTTNF
eukprot:TRINITY_DN2413_c0_g1_i1.p1 TRINITY_DN2413_c0_g1~~TRINITY_DN2413_c0_g1_i1.p1  ORF type:complete len:111 (-),score=14.10 TRINITY_DN2413_c0_g1_i1:120-452(-)